MTLGHMPGGEAPQIAVAIPAYRVAHLLTDVISRIPRDIQRIIVVDDACPEGSANVAENLTDERLVVLRHDRNQGVGGALKTAFAYAGEGGFDIIVKLDGDGQMDPEEIPRLVRPLVEGRAAYAKGNRFWHGAELRRMPALRRIGNLGLSFMSKVASGQWNVFDPTNGYFAIRTDVLGSLNWNTLPRGYFFELAMLIELGKRGYKVADIPMPSVYGDETSSLSVARSLTTFPFMLAWGTARRIFYRHFWFDFTATAVLIMAGLPLFLWGMGFGGYAWYRSVQSGEVATAGTVMLAALPFLLGVDFLLHALSHETSGTFNSRISPDDAG